MFRKVNNREISSKFYLEAAEALSLLKRSNDILLKPKSSQTFSGNAPGIYLLQVNVHYYQAAERHKYILQCIMQLTSLFKILKFAKLYVWLLFFGSTVLASGHNTVILFVLNQLLKPV